MNEIEILKTFAVNGPFAVAAYFLGRKILSAWDQDREQLRTIGRETLDALAALRKYLDTQK